MTPAFSLDQFSAIDAYDPDVNLELYITYDCLLFTPAS